MRLMPSSVNVADLTEPDIFSWATTWREWRDTRGRLPLFPRKANSGWPGDGETAKFSRLFSSLFVRWETLSTFAAARSMV